MDRNVDPDSDTLTDDVVALRKESVDRNITLPPFYAFSKKSLSARRAWIEIFLHDVSLDYKEVALRKESVDRNCVRLQLLLMMLPSLSARRAWIEIDVP